ncbi:MAG: GNAT family N-acetyltransferase [Eubacterium sp.]|nr:GNAT family N-acetyltransferase [Eubacterium sp.]
MEYIKATENNTQAIYELVQNTIKTVYPKYYTQDVVDFFSAHHCYENILSDIKNGKIWVLLVDNRVVGTGSCEDNHINRVFVSPDCQGMGYGGYIMRQLESEIALQYNTACLDSSLPGSLIYEHMGYKTVKHEKIECANGRYLVYEIMEKRLK